MVRAIVDDKLLVEGGIGVGLRLVPRQGLDVVVGNTIEYSEILGVLAIVSQRPIRTHDREMEEEPLDRFKALAVDDGLSFDDFGGYQHVVERARELIETQLGRKEHLDAIGATGQRNPVHWSSGTGKTMLAKIIPRQSGAEFFVISGPEIVSKWLGDSESLLRRVFEAAEGADRAIIFFDEIDSIAEKRDGDTHEASKRLVAQFLTSWTDSTGGPKVMSLSLLQQTVPTT